MSELNVAEKAAATNALLGSLPPEAARSRVLNTRAAAAYWGVSVPTWRRLYRAGLVPAPVKISARLLGWRASDLADALVRRVG